MSVEWVLKLLAAVLSLSFLLICISGSHDNNSSVFLKRLSAAIFIWTGFRTSLQVWYFFLLWSLVRLNCACNSFEDWQLSMGLTWIPRAFEPYHESCMSCGCINFWTNLFLLFLWVLAIVWQCCHTWFRAMLPGHWTNYPDTMWNYGWSAPGFPSPQSGLPYGQFCGGDMMRQQSQAQSQAQTQVQLAQLREQNSI